MTTLSEFKESLRSCSAPKLKVGDRVRVVRLSPGTDAKIGQIGTVREASNAPWIHFDEETGYALPIEELGIPAGFADCVSAEDLELVEETAPEPTPLAAFNEAANQIRSIAERGGYLPPSLGFRECADLDGSEAARFLTEHGFHVVSNRDTGRYGEATTADGLVLSTNGYTHLVAQGPQA